MTDKEKARAYDKLLVKAKQIYNKENDVLIMHTLEDLFPEIKESEDEKIMKGLIDYFSNFHLQTFAGLDPKKILAWLEEQDRQDLEWSKEENDKLSTIIAWIKDYPRLAKFNEEAFVRANNYAEWLKSIRNKYVPIKKIEHLKSQGEQKLADNPKPRFKAGQTIVNIYHNPDTDSSVGKIKEVTNDKYIFEGGSYIMISEQDYWKLDVEPKFKPGEWIAHNEANFVFQIISVGPNAYEVVNPDGYPKSIPFKNEEDYHLWTIHDVKEGDLVVEDKIPKHPSPFIAVFKAIGPDPDTFNSHCFIDFDGNFNDGDIGHDASNLHPATKEQRGILEKAITDSGFTFDSEKKELKDTKQKSDEHRFHEGEWIVSDSNNIAYIESVSKTEYNLQYKNGRREKMSINYVDKCWHSWTIQDVKDGDVLAEDSCIFIIKKLIQDNNAKVYCCLFDDGDFDINFNLGFDDTSTYPAAKEQRDHLFSEMKEKGYEWLEETKELKETGQEPSKPKFHEGEWIISDTVDKDYRICKITGIKDGNYSIESTCGYKGYNRTEVFDNTYRPWTIDEAKDGDVLAAKECYVIFKEITGLNIRCYCTYHYMGFSPSLSLGTLQNKAAFHPATKEESDTLWKAITNGGLKWNAEKKEFTAIKLRFDVDDDTIQYNGLGWSEEDEANLKRFTLYLSCKESLIPEVKSRYISWLNSLKQRIEEKSDKEQLKSLKDCAFPQQQEWSEEDENNINSIVSRLEVDISYWESRSKTRTNEDKRLIDWLKSLRPQNTWKPSKEQIIALRWVLNNVPYNKHKEEINGLLDQIKEL